MGGKGCQGQTSSSTISTFSSVSSRVPVVPPSTTATASPIPFRPGCRQDLLCSSAHVRLKGPSDVSMREVADVEAPCAHAQGHHDSVVEAGRARTNRPAHGLQLRRSPPRGSRCARQHLHPALTKRSQRPRISPRLRTSLAPSDGLARPQPTAHVRGSPAPAIWRRDIAHTASHRYPGAMGCRTAKCVAGTRACRSDGNRNTGGWVPRV